MAGPHQDELVEIVFDQPRRLFFNLKALRSLDRAMGEVGILKVLDLLRAANFTTLERVLWAGFLHDEPKLLIADVTKRLEAFVDAGGNASELFATAYRALDQSKVFGGREGNVTPEAVTTS